MTKKEFPPLLEPGLHSFEVSELEALTVSNFPNSSRRVELFNALLSFLQSLSGLGILGNLWVDGSFLTEKEEPADIDALFEFHGPSAETLSDEQRRFAESLLDPRFAKARFGIDLYLCPQDQAAQLSYWRGWFGFCRDSRTAKGIAIIGVDI